MSHPALIKAVVVVATDKRTWVVVGSVIGDLVLMIVGVVAAFLNVFSYDDTGSSTAPSEYGVASAGDDGNSYI